MNPQIDITPISDGEENGSDDNMDMLPPSTSKEDSKVNKVSCVKFDWYSLLSYVSQYMRDEEVGLNHTNFRSVFKELETDGLVVFKNSSTSKHVAARQELSMSKLNCCCGHPTPPYL